MLSHRCSFRLADLIPTIGGPAASLALIACGLHLAARFGWLPAPRPSLDMDRAILVAQADRSRDPDSIAALALIGDSSCLMNVDAPRLEARLQTSAQNLGTLSFLDPPSFASLLNAYVDAHEKAPDRVLLLVHPEFLRRAAPSPAHVAALWDYLNAEDNAYAVGPAALADAVLGAHIVRGRLLGRLPQPLLGPDFRSYYGFTVNLERHMNARRGSAYDPRRLKPEDLRGSARYRLSPRMARELPAIREALPEGAQLVVGLTPVPKSFAPPGYEDIYQTLLKELAVHAQADAALVRLPAVLEDGSFANRTHLRPAATERYTGLLARALIETSGL